MSSVYFDPGLGGDGSTVSDDADPTTGLASGGHRSRFVPALSNLVSVSRAAVNAANAAAASLQAATYAGSSTSALVVGPGSKTITTQAGKGWFVGQWLQLVAAGGAWLVGQVVSYNGTTLVLDASWFGGSGTVAHWTILPGSPWNVNSAQVTAKLAELTAWQTAAQLDWPFHRLSRNQFGNLSGEDLAGWQTYRTKVKVSVKRDIVSGIAWADRDDEARTILTAMGMSQAVHFMPHVRVLRMTWQKEAGADNVVLPFQIMPARSVLTVASYARLINGALANGPNAMYLAGITREWGLCGRHCEPSTAGDYMHVHPFCQTDTGEVELILPAAVAGRFPLDRANPRWGWFDHRSALTNFDISI